jgi:enoyl-CoA hydratase
MRRGLRARRQACNGQSVAYKHTMENTPLDASYIIVQVDGSLGRLTLNRPAALHALNLEMVQSLTNALLAWRDDPKISLVLLDHNGPRGFCAGGDIAMLAASGAGDGQEARAFFHAEYRLNDLIFGYDKPIIAVMDGVTMGGGVGLAIHAPFRIATERTIFAMPETGIGLFPDVGGGWFLPRLPGQIGIWLALTGTRLRAGDAIKAEVATHFVPHDLIGALKAQMAGAASTRDPAAALSSGLAAMAEDAPAVQELTDDALAKISACFGHDSVEPIFAALADDGSDWALRQLAMLQTKSPQTLKVALRQMRLGAKAISFAENMKVEYRIGCRVVGRHDFQAGVRAVIIDKTNTPIWNPANLADVTPNILAEIFAPLPPEEEWTPLS